MNRLIYLIIFFSYSIAAFYVSGSVVDEKGKGIAFANVYIKDSFDGTSTDENGQFEFETYESNEQTLVVGFVGYEEYNKKINLINDVAIDEIVLIQSAAQMTEVVITAGSFEASDENRAAILKPLDIVTTAGARGDISGALQKLPGSQPQNEKEGLFVRGGDASESKTIVDGLLIQNPYGSSVPDVPQRGRFTPFEFEGTVFSTGGYSAQYGQALSSVVDLTTWNSFRQADAHTFGITPLNVTYGRVYSTNDIACGLRFDISDIKYFQEMNNDGVLEDYIKSNTEFIEAPKGFNFTTNMYKKLPNGIIKYNGRFSANQLTLDIDKTDTESDEFNLENDNTYISLNYRGTLDDSWAMQIGGSYSTNNDEGNFVFSALDTLVDAGEIDEPELDISNSDNLFQIRSMFVKNIFSGKVKFGLHLFNRSGQFSQIQTDYLSFFESYDRDINDLLLAGFIEMDFKISSKIAMRFGLRSEQSDFLDKSNFSPRLSLAYKVGRFDQISYAYGTFYQTPEIGLDPWYQRSQPTPSYYLNSDGTLISDLDFEKSTHHIFNYQWIRGKRVFRLELYDKEYEQLIKSNIPNDWTPSTNITTINNDGYGYARGLDLFWRDNGYTFENIDYWISYSYLDTKRNYRDFVTETRPSFAAEHVLSLIYKQNFEINDLRVQLSLGCTGTSGRPWFDDREYLLNAQTGDFDIPNTQYGEHVSKPYQSFSIGGSIIPKVKEGNFMVIFFNLTNPFGYKNIYGKRKNDATGEYEDVLPTSMRSIFIGCFVFFSKGELSEE